MINKVMLICLIMKDLHEHKVSFWAKVGERLIDYMRLGENG